MLKRTLILAGVSILLLGISSCASRKDLAESETKLVEQKISEIKDAQTGDGLSQTNTDAERKAAQNGEIPTVPKIDISGVAFAPGALPHSLAGKIFYSTQSFGGQIEFKSDDEAVFKPFKKDAIEMKYKVVGGDSPQLVLEYESSGESKKIAYNTQRGGNYALLQAAEPEEPFPLMLKGIAEE